jgi:hypothetical protein
MQEIRWFSPLSSPGGSPSRPGSGGPASSTVSWNTRLPSMSAALRCPRNHPRPRVGHRRRVPVPSPGRLASSTSAGCAVPEQSQAATGVRVTDHWCPTRLLGSSRLPGCPATSSRLRLPPRSRCVAAAHERGPAGCRPGQQCPDHVGLATRRIAVDLTRVVGDVVHDVRK